MKRLLILLAFLAPPAVAQDGPAYDDALMSACLDRAAEAVGGRATADDLRGCIGTASDACMAAPGGDTTVGMVGCLNAEAKQWDMLLNAFYSKALDAARAADADLEELDSAAEPAAPSLQQAQRHWIGFRDGSCRYESLRFQGGTAGGPASMGCMLQLTAEQALRLRDVARGWGEWE